MNCRVPCVEMKHWSGPLQFYQTFFLLATYFDHYLILHYSISCSVKNRLSSKHFVVNFVAQQCNLCPRRTQGYKLHWRTLNEKLRAINICNPRQRLLYLYYKSFSFQKLREEWKMQCRSLADLTFRNCYTAARAMIVFIPAKVSLMPGKTMSDELPYR